MHTPYMSHALDLSDRQNLKANNDESKDSKMIVTLMVLLRNWTIIKMI